MAILIGYDRNKQRGGCLHGVPSSALTTDQLDKTLTGFEFGRFLGGNLDFFTSAGVTAHAGGTLVDIEGAETYESDFLAFSELFFDYVNACVEGIAGIDFGQTCFFCHGCN